MEIRVEELLRKELQDEVIIFQTDTVYGIGCKLNSEAGVKRIYDIKKRDGNKPLAVLCADTSDVQKLVHRFEDAAVLADAHWPGALTLVFPKRDTVPDYVTSGMDTVGVRIPDDLVALAILRKFGPMAVTSLNLSSEPAILEYAKAKQFHRQVDYLVIGTDLHANSSTVYDVTHKKVLRQGDIVIR